MSLIRTARRLAAGVATLALACALAAAAPATAEPAPGGAQLAPGGVVTLDLGCANPPMDGLLVRAQVENAHGSVTSEAALLTVTLSGAGKGSKPRG